MDVRDTLIAGVAVHRRAVVATRNVRHYDDLEAGVMFPGRHETNHHDCQPVGRTLTPTLCGKREREKIQTATEEILSRLRATGFTHRSGASASMSRRSFAGHDDG